MEKLFSTDYLVAGKSGTNEMRTFCGKVVPGRQLEMSDPDKILLSGGFASVLPETAFPLSPTLQLNRDMTSCSNADLLAIAEAEHDRQQSIYYHNYHLEPNCHVCVIASDSIELDRFIENYGGVLEIEPLLVKGSHSEYTTASEIQFEQKAGECLVSYQKRAPLKFELCTYCGACGQICPEKCISPQLFVDFKKCTFCKECEKACSTDAIDISGVEEIVLHAPAIILLGDVALELPENSKSIFHENDLPEFFKTIYSAEIKEVVCHNNSICQYSGRLGAGCARCVDSCPYGAITKGETGIQVDHILCEECGRCVSVCPTGAMQNGYLTDKVLLQYLEKLSITKGGELVIGSEDELLQLWWQRSNTSAENTFFLEYSSKHFLSFFHLLLFFAIGFRKVTLLVDEQTRDSSLATEITKANSIVSSLFGDDFAGISKVGEFVAVAGNDTKHPLQKFVQLHTYENRRASLAQILSHLIAAAGIPIASDTISQEFLSISCDEQGCTHCLACLNECKTKALQADEEKLSLTYQPGLCVGCAVCIKVCPEKVLSLESGKVIDQQFFTRGVLAQAEPAKCRACGKVYGSQKSLDRVLQILSSKESVDTAHFQYCSDCKVIKLFEAQES